MGRKYGGCSAYLGPRLTQCALSRGLISYQVVSSYIQPFGHNRHGPTIGWGCALFLGSCIPIEHKVAWAEAYLHTKWHLSPSSRLATTDIGRKLEDCAPLGEGDLGPHLSMSPRIRSTSIPKWYPDTCSHLATIDMGLKLGELCPFGGAARSLSNKMSPGPRPTSVPSCILIHPTAWTQCTNVTDRQTDRQTMVRAIRPKARAVETRPIVMIARSCAVGVTW